MNTEFEYRLEQDMGREQQKGENLIFWIIGIIIGIILLIKFI